MKARHKIRVCSVGVSPGGDRVTAQEKSTQAESREDKQMLMGGN